MTTVYNHKFKEIKALGSGGFSNVYAAISINDGKTYAIKKIALDAFNEEKVLKEVIFLLALESDYVVKYYDSWIEENYYLHSLYDDRLIKINDRFFLNIMKSKPLLLHIQMELCSLTLREVIDKIGRECKTHNGTLSLAGLYIASEIFVEILESVQFIHLQNPPIIHRDLKPENILITNFINKRFVRLTDFGLSTFHEFDEYSHTKYVGTRFYRAPELLYCTFYNWRIDLYSLGVILIELFHFDLNNKKINEYPNKVISKIRILESLAVKMLSAIPEKRPDCTKILNDKNLWQIKLSDLNHDKNQSFLIPEIQSIDQDFIKFFMQKKLEVEEIKIETGYFSRILSSIFKKEEIKVDIKNFNKVNLKNKLDLAKQYNDLNKPNKYVNYFSEICPLGNGAFSTVFKAIDRDTNALFAIKKVSFKLEKIHSISKEFNILIKLKNEYVVKCFDAWIEENYYISNAKKFGLQNTSEDNILFNRNYNLLLHMQLEICPMTLRDVIKKITNECVTAHNKLSIIGYYIASELFIEIFECVQYLHEQNPPIIHRDLKPENILISYSLNRFVKISDFGLSTYHEFINQSHTKYVGTIKYRSQDLNTSKYTIKADVDSLGVVIEDLFDFKIARNSISNYDPVLVQKMKNVNDVIIKLRDPSPEKRPNCCDILKEKELFTLNENEIECSEIQNLLSKCSKDCLEEDEFVTFFVKKKYKSNKLAKETLKYEESTAINFLYTVNIVDKPHFYKKIFSETYVIGTGNFSTVFKSFHKIDKIPFSVKKIGVNRDNRVSILQKLSILKNLNCQYNVMLYDSWIEENYYTSSILSQNSQLVNYNSSLFNNNFPEILHIQIEFCPLSLRDVINKLYEFGSLKNNTSFIYYYISSELFYEIMDCVNYLHQQDPPIIHRCLKPENILLTKIFNNRCVKLSDFGLTLDHEESVQVFTSYRKSQNYKAIELINSNYGTTKSDTYSIGLIGRELFNFDLTSEICETSEESIVEKVGYIKKVIEKQVKSKPQKRIDLLDVMIVKDKWLLSREELAKNQLFENIFSKLPKAISFEQNIIEYLVQNKNL